MSIFTQAELAHMRGERRLAPGIRIHAERIGWGLEGVGTTRATSPSSRSADGLPVRGS
jgi:hypothetical protein